MVTRKGRHLEGRNPWIRAILADRLGNQIYATSISGPNKEKCLVSAFDLSTGKLLWTKESATGMTEQNTIYVSRAASSPAADADGVVAFFEGGIVVAYTHSGEERWKRNLSEEFGLTKTRHGLSSSIAQLDDSIFVWVEREKEPYVLAISKKDGKEIWKVPGLGKTAWSSPSLLTVGEEQHLVLSAQTMAVGLNSKTGERLWNLEGLVGNTTPSPRALPDGKSLLGASARGDQGGTGSAAQSNALVQVKKMRTVSLPPSSSGVQKKQVARSIRPSRMTDTLTSLRAKA